MCKKCGMPGLHDKTSCPVDDRRTAASKWTHELPTTAGWYFVKGLYRDAEYTMIEIRAMETDEGEHLAIQHRNQWFGFPSFAVEREETLGARLYWQGPVKPEE